MANIDEKDKLILFELFQNSRQPYSKIAKELRIPEKTVENRIKNMLKRGIIRKFSAIINYQKLGKNRHSLYLDLKAINKEKEKEFIKEILKIREVSCCYYLHEMSKWKIYISIWTKMIDDYDKIQSKILSLFGDKVLNYISFQGIKSYTYLTRLLNPKKQAKCSIKEGIENIQLDKTEEKLIKILVNDSRKPTLEIAKEINVHADTIRKNIKRLMDKGIILRFYPLINFQKVGIKEYTMIARLNPARQDYEKRLEEFIIWARANPHFVIIIKAIGWVNLYYAFQVENNQQFKDIRKEIDEKIGDLILEEFRIEVEEILQ